MNSPMTVIVQRAMAASYTMLDWIDIGLLHLFLNKQEQLQREHHPLQVYLNSRLCSPGARERKGRL